MQQNKNCKEMTVEELMVPRIKLIAPIPKIFSCGIEVGEVWQGKEVDGVIMFNLTGAHCIDLDSVKKYPHLFKILEWWEDRKIEDMPKYMKWKTADGDVYTVKITDIYGKRFKGEFKNGKTMHSEFTPNQDYPATEQEYLNQTA